MKKFIFEVRRMKRSKLLKNLILYSNQHPHVDEMTVPYASKYEYYCRVQRREEWKTEAVKCK